MVLPQTNKSEPEHTGDKELKVSPKTSKLTTRGILNAIGGRFFGKTQSEGDGSPPSVLSTTDSEKNGYVEKLKEGSDSKCSLQKKDSRKMIMSRKTKMDGLEENYEKKCERDCQKYRMKFNNGIGNIVRRWMNLTYCILILRLNLMKFLLENFPECGDGLLLLEKQMRLESKTMYSMIRRAQNESQERALYIWVELKKLIFSRMAIKRALEMQGKDTSLRDWKGAAERLTHLEEEYRKTQALYKDMQKRSLATEGSSKAKLLRLQTLNNAKKQEMACLIEQITECKKREVQMRGRILLNMKNYKDLSVKRKQLANLERDLDQLKKDQEVVSKEYADKIEDLTMQIEEKEKMIEAEREEGKKIKETLHAFGDTWKVAAP